MRQNPRVFLLVLGLAFALAACAVPTVPLTPSAAPPSTAATSSREDPSPSAAETASPSPTSSPTPVPSPSSIPTQAPWKGDGTVVAEIEKKLRNQTAVDAALLAEMGSGAYTADSPLVVLDPYDCAPLSALVLFRTDVPMSVSVHVPGRAAADDVDADLPQYVRDHWVPVYGLYPDAANAVTLTTCDVEGRRAEIRLTIRTQPLPPELSAATVAIDALPSASLQPGFTFPFTLNDRKTAFDSKGAIRWYLKASYLQSGNYGINGRFLFVQGKYGVSEVVLQETDPLGRIHRVLWEPYGLHHDVVAYGTDSLLCTNNQGSDVGDYMIELDTKTGTIRARLDLDEVFQRNRTPLSIANSADWLHQNTIVLIPGSTDILVSARNQSLIARIAWPSGTVRWILSDPKGWNATFQKLLLAPTGDGFLYSYGQHDPLILPDQDGNPDTLDLLVFDNGLERFGAATDPRNYSRLVQYRIDEVRGTAEQVWQWGQDSGASLFSAMCGSVDVLPNGNLLADFHPTTSGILWSKVLEIAPDGSVVWSAEIRLDGGATESSSYRAVRQSLYAGAAADPAIGTPVVDLIPASVRTKHGVPP